MLLAYFGVSSPYLSSLLSVDVVVIVSSLVLFRADVASADF
ncbi:35019_t:CDS:2 [Gigaspora margarita]|uniref:35019_t:CDS:1 n=1 Tax=Gigaspora margarita TaxID=4874 RepID=A0ABN7UGS4_GIGMA|nr:35019_t:CDS:2 [Gigaspora margarita]